MEELVNALVHVGAAFGRIVHGQEVDWLSSLPSLRINTLFLVVYYVLIDDEDTLLLVLVAIRLEDFEFFAHEGGLDAEYKLVPYMLHTALVMRIGHALVNLT